MGWKEVSKKAAEQRAVFIVGVPRSGTSVLYRTLQTLPDFATNGDTRSVDITETHIFSGVLVSNMANEVITDRNSRAFSYYLKNQGVWKTFCRSVATLRRWQTAWQKVLSRSGRMTLLFGSSAATGGVFWRLVGDPQILRSYFYHARLARHSARIIEKTPAHLHHLPKIRITFPRAAIIAMVRHPVEVFASHRKRLKRELAAGTSPKRLAWLEQSPEEFCDMYGGMVSDLRTSWHEAGAAVIVCKYETLTQDSKRELSRICAFIGSTYSSSLLSDNDVLIGGHRPDAGKIDQMLSRPIQPRSSGWQGHVSPDTALDIEARLGVELEWLEYESVLWKD